MKKKTGRFIKSTTHEAKVEHQAVNRKGGKRQNWQASKKQSIKNLALAKMAEIEKTYGSMMDYYNKEASIDCKILKNMSVFVTAEGLVLPCCWTAGRMYKWWHGGLQAEQIWDFIDRAGGKDAINAKLFGIEGVFESGIMDDIKRSWKLQSIKEGKLGVCAQKCGKSLWHSFSNE